MRISRDQKKKNFEKLLRATATLAQKYDFDSITMRAIAAEAGISEPAIYNYFAKKEDLLTEFFDWSLEESIAKTMALENFSQLKFADKLHAFIEEHLEFLEQDKRFAGQIHGQLFVQPIPLIQTQIGKSRKRLVDWLDSEMNEAVKKGEFPDPPFRTLMCELMWDFHVGVIFYWLKDSSEGSMNTTQMVDLSIGIFRELLAGGIMNKAYALAHFLIKEHLLTKLFSQMKF